MASINADLIFLFYLILINLNLNGHIWLVATLLISSYLRSVSHRLHTKNRLGASLVAQWLGIRLPMQRTRVRAPVREDPTCRGATRPVSLNY